MTEKKEKLKDGTLLGRLHDKDYVSLKDEIEGVVAGKINDRIKSAKDSFIASVRGDQTQD